MTVGRRMRREIRGINRWMRRESYRWGQAVTWYEFNPESVADTVDRDLYDEGGPQFRPWTPNQGTSRGWKAPKTVQLYSARIDEGSEDYSEEGQYVVDRFYGTANTQLLRNFGIDPSLEHVNDRIEFDGRLFSIDAFERHGWVADVNTVCTIRGTQVMEDEQHTDSPTWYA